MCDVVDSIPVKPMESGIDSAAVSVHEVPSQVNALNGVEGGESVNSANAASLADNASNAEQPLSTNIDAFKEEGEAAPTSEKG
ncbi:hypothetical protein LSM04_008379 [Trypanosoma melophagium]|uniref:uncharacterized protein n=1 Tax=Trypanosoma melophagium TaxID=715481 RepID=UPI00351A3312|nr:hypothetical protein LSM04_008379 [Trypanosoma melophagium]